MPETIAVETAAMERQEWQDTRPQDQYVDRGKFTCCRLCGGVNGMQHTRRETLASMGPAIIATLAPWYSEPGNDECLFFVCRRCNRDRNIPNGFEPMGLYDLLDWLVCDPTQTDYSQYDWGEDPREMEPDYEALAREEPVLASQADRDAAGTEE